MATDPRWLAAFAGYALLLLAAAALARMPASRFAGVLWVETPFLAFAALLPFVGSGPTVSVGPAELSQPGLWAAWNIVVKAMLGLTAATLLAATTRPAEIIAGLERLRLPVALTTILTFFVRYVDVVVEVFGRMRLARAARGYRAAGPRSWPVLGRSLGVLFVRSYERGERVHMAMLSRGYAGHMPASTGSGAGWLLAGLLPMLAVAIHAVVRLWA